MSPKRTHVKRKRPAGQPPKLTPEVEDRIVRAIRAGNYFNAACLHAGVPEAVGREWLARGKGTHERPPYAAEDPPGVQRYASFAEAVARAEGDAEVHAVGVLRGAMQSGEWRAAVEWLKRRHPDTWRDEQRIEHAGTVDQHVVTEPSEEHLAAVFAALEEAGVVPPQVRANGHVTRNGG